MQIVRDVPTLRELVAQSRMAARPVAFVPTMGALHAGHVSLVRLARAAGGLTVVSIFVNPLQFAPGEDLARYPRREEEDAALLEREGADVLYLPTEASLYPPDFSTVIEVAGVSEGGEGAMRPGHFRGVATVVAKLFLRVLPDVAVFGRKDLQQVAVVRRLIRDLDLPIRLRVGEIVRESDGLALSSRNAYLSPEDRRRAPDLARTLFAARARAVHGARDARHLEEEAVRQLEAARFQIDYVEAVDPLTMRRVTEVRKGICLAAAVRLGQTRLLDNVYLLDPKRT
ncbi:MAG TPA: pantoate--beta-alanine ligase [Thermoanaerobaculia bacterium]|nr:pantoate--beta-alanine ligase [Thermoanaerobaculia bacterium]